MYTNMDLKRLLLFFHILLNISGFSKANENQNVVKIVRNYISTMDRRPQVNAFLCWKENENINVIKDMMSDGIATSLCKNGSELIFSKFEFHNQLFLLDLSCDIAWDIIKHAQEEHYLGAPFRWILMDSRNEILTMDVKKTEDEIQTRLGSYDINTDSEISAIVQISEDEYDIYSFYKMGRGQSFTFETLGKWNGNEIIDQRVWKITSYRRRNLMGTPLIGSLVLTNNDTINHLDDRIDVHIDTVTKTNYVFTMVMAEYMNFTITFMYTDHWGWINDKGEWSGMVGHMQRGLADLGGTPIFLLPARFDVLELLGATTADIVIFVFRQPPLSYVSNLFTLPFSTPVWIASLILLLILIGATRICTAWEYHKSKLIQEGNFTDSPNWSDVCLMAVGAVCQQGYPVEFSVASGRLSQFVTFLAMMFLFTSYSASIVSLLQSTTSSISTLKDLLESNLEFGVEDNIYNRKYFAEMEEPVRKAIYETKIAPPGVEPAFMDIKEGVAKMREGLFAFHMQAGVGYKLMEDTYYEHEKCNLQSIAYLPNSLPHYPIKKFSPYKEIIKVGIKKLAESGLQSRENSRVVTKKPPCLNKEGSFVSVGIHDCYAALLWFSYGILCAMFFLTMEWIMYYRRKRMSDVQPF